MKPAIESNGKLYDKIKSTDAAANHSAWMDISGTIVIMSIVRLGAVAAIVVGSTIGALALSFHHVTDGGTNQAKSSIPYSFSVKDAEIDSHGYYTPSGKLSVFVIKPKPKCLGSKDLINCTCTGFDITQDYLDHPNDYSYVEAHGWPIAYAYFLYTCGSNNTYVILPVLLDAALFAAAAGMLVFIVMRIQKHYSLRLHFKRMFR